MQKIKAWGLGLTIISAYLLGHSPSSLAATNTAGKMHIGTFEGSTTFTTSSSNGINPGLFLEVRDADGNFKQYTSEEGVITVPNTKEGAYVTQAKLLGKTKYRDQDTGELLDEWEDGRNLELESVQMPGLTTSNYKNLANDIFIDYGYNSDGTIDNQKKWLISDFISIEPNVSYTTRSQGATNDGVFTIAFYDEDKTFISKKVSNSAISPTNAKFARINVRKSDGLDITEEEKNDTILYLEKTAEVLPFESYKSNILTVNEPIELRRVGNVQDTLDLMTGELVQRIGEIKITDEMIDKFTIYGNFIFNFESIFDGLPERKIVRFEYGKPIPMVSDKMAVKLWSNGTMVENTVYFTQDKDGDMRVYHTPDWTLDEFKEWFREKKPTIQYELATPIVKTVGLNSTYQFNLVSDSVVQVKGDILPTIYSITVPTDPLTFAINPNAGEGQQFIAPEFSITNESPGPVQLELKSFTQTTNVLNDVLPDAHSDWTQLNLAQSRDIALALVPKPSDGWLTLNEGEKYVANTSNTLLGEIKRNTTVDFSFSAFHGGVFDQNLFPEYRLVFTFGF